MQPILEKFKNHVSKENFIKDCENFKVDEETRKFPYTDFIKYFNGLKTITKHELVIGINFCYGMMPTKFDFRSENYDEALIILNAAKNGIVPTQEQLEILKGLLNNSLVGTSKLLHFINPKIFAIWDSRVYRYLTGEKAYNHRIGNCEAYLSFLTFCDYLTQRKEYDEAHNFICKKLDLPMTKFRSAELIMYLNGSGKNKNNSI